MEIRLNITHLILLNILFNFYEISNSLINNPKKTTIKIQTDSIEYSIKPENNHIQIFTPSLEEKNLEIKEEINDIKFLGSTLGFSKFVFPCVDVSNNYFLVIHDNYYSININENKEIISLTLNKTLPKDHKYFGYITEKYFHSGRYGNDNICSISKNEIIIYGIVSKKIIFFYYTSENRDTASSFSGNFEIKELSCKLIESSCYMCIYIKDDSIYITIITFTYSGSSSYKGIKINKTEEINGFQGYKNIIIYDTNDSEYKIICAQKDNVLCKIIYINVIIESYKLSNITFSFIDIDNFNTESVLKENKCDLNVFNNEYLM